MGPHLSAVIHLGAYHWAYVGDQHSAATKGLENRWSAREPDRHKHSGVGVFLHMWGNTLCHVPKEVLLTEMFQSFEGYGKYHPVLCTLSRGATECALFVKNAAQFIEFVLN